MTGHCEAPSPARRLPGTPEPCDHCGVLVVWATTVASPRGPGGKAQAFDPVEDPRGRVAVRPAHGRLLARALEKDEVHDPPLEYLGMPHVATCREPA